MSEKILEQIAALPDDVCVIHISGFDGNSGNVLEWRESKGGNPKQIVTDLKSLRAELLAARRVIQHYADENKWNSGISGEFAYLYRVSVSTASPGLRAEANGYDLAAEFLKQFPPAKD